MNEIEKLEKELKDLYEKEYELREKIDDLKLKSINLDLEGKYIQYYDDCGVDHYCYVNWIDEDKRRYGNFTYSYRFSGLGFQGEFTGYEDCTRFYWDFSYEFYVYSNDIDNFKSKIDRIKIIDKNEFDSKLLEKTTKLIEYHNKYSREEKG